MTKRQERIWLRIFKDVGYIMDVPPEGVSMESVRDFLLEMLGRENWMDDMFAGGTGVDLSSHMEPDESIGYIPPAKWRK
jgi:hypothetical protein